MYSAIGKITIDMIKSDLFYAAFKNGFASQKTAALIAPRRGKPAKYYAMIGNDELSFWFKVNSKASAFPNQPGEFWPVIETKQLRHDQRDNGLVSWYQYTDELTNDEMKCIQQTVYAKVENQTEFELPAYRSLRDVRLPSLRREIEGGFKAQRPHDHLLYLDERDAEFWGKWFAMQLIPWMEKFCAHPETLEGYMWRVHWNSKS
jgi:hypothetical protein